MTEDKSKNVEVEMNFNAPVTNAVGRNDGLIITNVSERKQIIVEAVAEIQKLLKQFEEQNPQATESEQIIYINATITPTPKERMIGALQAGGESAIDEFVLKNKYFKVIKAIVKGWIDPS
jgi:hypothetical protein